MKLFKLSICAAFAAFMFTACDDSSSASDDDKNVSSSSVKEKEPASSASADKKLDCTVSGGVTVFSPKKGDSFKMGETITVVYGSDVQGSGYRFVFKTSEDDDAGLDLLEESAGPAKPDGKTCYEQKVVLTEDVAEPTETAIIRVVPYEKTSKAGNSGTFKVTE